MRDLRTSRHTLGSLFKIFQEPDLKDRARVEGQGITGAKVEQSTFFFGLRAPRSADLMRCTARKSVVDEGAPDSQHDQLSTRPCKTPIKLYRCLRTNKPFFSLQSLRCTSHDRRSEKHCTSPSYVRTTHESRIVGQPGKSTTSIVSSKVKNPNPMLHLIQTISPSYTPLPGVMTALALQISLILEVEFHAVCRCTICGTQVDSEARIPGITMTVRVNIFKKAVVINLQTYLPKSPNQLCDSHSDLIEHTTNVHLIPPLTTITDTRK